MDGWGTLGMVVILDVVIVVGDDSDDGMDVLLNV